MKKRHYFVWCLLGALIFPHTLGLAQESKENGKKGREGAERREFLEKHKEELKGLSPEERQAKMRELRKNEGAKRPEFKGMSSEQRQAKRKEMRERLQKQLVDLRKKQAEGTLTDQEKRRLQRMEEVAKRFEQMQGRGGAWATNRVGQEPLKQK